MAIRNPVEWIVDQFRTSAVAVGAAGHDLRESHEQELHTMLPAIRRIGVADLKDALARGWEDFKASRTDVIFLCVIYPLVGLILGGIFSGYDLLPLLFPLASGFALVGPFAAVGLNEMSRLREQGVDASLGDAFGVVRSPAFGTIVLFGLLLMAILLFWLVVAAAIYDWTLGPDQPASFAAFMHDVFTTGAGWTMIVVGIAVGFVFALVVLGISVVSFPLLLDRHGGIETAIETSMRALRANPGPILLWGLIVAVLLVLGSIPALLGLVIVMPVLGHATWHLYRKLVAYVPTAGLR
jgi:uncharacterized membrane protein